MRGLLEVLLLKLASDRVLVTEDEVKLNKIAIVSKAMDALDSLMHTLVPGQVKSGPNMIVQGVLSENSLPAVWKPSSSNLR